MSDTIKVQLDLSKSSLRDWRLIGRLTQGHMMDDIEEWLEFLSRVLIGGTEAYPMTALYEVIRAVAESIQASANPKAPAA